MGIAEDFERMGSELRQRAGSDPFAAVAELALQRVPAASCVSITTLAHDRFTTAAATDDVARRADLIQYELGSGPCVDAILDDTIYRPADLEHDTRWPEYGAQVSAELGLHSMLSYRMSLDTAGLIAGLNFYAVGVDAFSDHDVGRGTAADDACGAGRLSGAPSREGRQPRAGARVEPRHRHGHRGPDGPVQARPGAGVHPLADRQPEQQPEAPRRRTGRHRHGHGRRHPPRER